MERFVLNRGAFCILHRACLTKDAAGSLLAQLMDEVPWESRAITLFGREVMQPRLVAFVGDPDAIYTYSRTRHEPAPWTPHLAALRLRVSEIAGVSFNSVLCNLYRDGRDSMGLHSDSEPELGPDPIIASLSLGATRRFSLRAKAAHSAAGTETDAAPHADAKTHGDGVAKLDLELSSGSLLVMAGTTQRFYRHAVPKQPSISAPRINLTFRSILAAE